MLPHATEIKINHDVNKMILLSNKVYNRFFMNISVDTFYEIIKVFLRCIQIQDRFSDHFSQGLFRYLLQRRRKMEQGNLR